MSIRNKIIFGIAATVLLWGQIVRADDIDLFKAGSNITGSPPNVLFVIDNGASWNSNFGDMKASQMVLRALWTVLTSPDLTGKVNVGIMPFSHGNSPKGGKVMAAVAPLTAAYQAALSCKLYNTTPDPTTGICPDTLGDEILPQTNNSPYGLTFNEAYLYYKGGAPASGTQDGDQDPKAFTSSAETQYLSPTATAPCAHNFIIFIGTGTPDSGENTLAQSTLSALGGVLPSDPIPLSPSLYQSSWGDEYARFLSTAVINPNVTDAPSITTYAVDVYDSGANPTNSFKSARAYFKSVAKNGKGSYFAATSADQVATAINDIMTQVQAVNTVFASVSLPISVNVQGTNLNQVYIGMFRPDSQWRPRWFGNLKRYQYQFDSTTNTPYLADANGNPAYDPATGFIVANAQSWWTTGSTYWNFDSATYPNSSDSPDGPVVEKGAVGEMLRKRTTSRVLYTCAGGCSSTSLPRAFSTSNTTVMSDVQAAIPATSSDTPSDVVNWAIGQDVQDENNNGSTTDIRPSIQGDVLHSRPAVINYGPNATHQIVVFYASNDGFVRAVDGGSGDELWGFIPGEQVGKLVSLYDNNVMTSSSEKPYFVDGNISVIVQYSGSGSTLSVSHAYLYLCMRRGGRYIYAFDITDPTAPKFMWEDKNTDTGFGELGETWSMPKPAYVKAFGTTPVLIFGAGYDAPVEDLLPSTGVARTMGRGLFMVDALNGTLLWEAGPSPSGAQYNMTVSGMNYSIPSDVGLANVTGNTANDAERIYVGDTGGNVWRINIADSSPDNWTAAKIASVGGCSSTSGSTDCRKFLYPPSIVLKTGYVELLMGTGDREHPFDTSVTNRFYMFEDTYPTSEPAPLTESNLYDVTSVTNATASTISNAGDYGWYMTLPNSGEKVVGNALTLNGITYFNTTTPPSPQTDANGNVISCSSNLGTAREYYVTEESGAIDKDIASGRSDIMPGGGFPPPPIAITLFNNGKAQTDVGGLHPWSPGPSQTGKRTKTFWFDSLDTK